MIELQEIGFGFLNLESSALNFTKGKLLLLHRAFFEKLEVGGLWTTTFSSLLTDADNQLNCNALIAELLIILLILIGGEFQEK